MPDLVPTGVAARSVDAAVEMGTSGEALPAGRMVYQDNTTNKWMLSDCTIEAKAKVQRVVIQAAAAADSPVLLMRPGDLFTLGVGLVSKGHLYVLSTAGQIAPVADLDVGDIPIVVGVGNDADDIMFMVLNTGVVR